MSIESDLEALADKLETWADQDRASATTAQSDLKSYWLGRADGWEEAARYVRKAVDENASKEIYAIYTSVAMRHCYPDGK